MGIADLRWMTPGYKELKNDRPLQPLEAKAAAAKYCKVQDAYAAEFSYVRKSEIPLEM